MNTSLYKEIEYLKQEDKKAIITINSLEKDIEEQKILFEKKKKELAVL